MSTSLSDAAFFEQNPDRHFQLRLATPSEVKRALKGVEPVEPNHFIFIAAHRADNGDSYRALAAG